MKKISNIWKLNNILPDNPQVKEKNKREIRMHFEIMIMYHPIYKNL